MALSVGGNNSFLVSKGFWTEKDKLSNKENHLRLSNLQSFLTRSIPDTPAHPSIKENPLKKIIERDVKIQNLRPLLRKVFSNFKDHIVDSQDQAIQKLNSDYIGNFYIWPSTTSKGVVSAAIKLESGIRSLRLFGPFEEIFTRAQIFGQAIKVPFSARDCKYLDFIINLPTTFRFYERSNIPHRLVKSIFDQNKMIKNSLEVETALSKAEAFDFRFWKSLTKPGAISYAVKLPWGLIDVRRVDANLWKPEHIPLITRAGALLIELKKFYLDRAQKTKFNKKQYDQQIILNLGKGNTAKGLGGKAQQNGVTSNTIDLRTLISAETKQVELADEHRKLFENLTYDSRLYAVGHCNKGTQTIFSDEGTGLSAAALAEAVLKYAPHLKKANPDAKKLLISIVACFGGEATNPQNDNSFCDTLQKEMNLRGIQCEILGRLDNMSRWDGRPTGYKKFVGGRHHVTGDKLIWTANKKKEVHIYPETTQMSLTYKNLDFIDMHSSLENHILNLGEMNDKESEQLLQSYDSSVWHQKLWVLRKDPATQQMMITTYADNQFTHQAVDKHCQNLEQLLQNSNWPVLFRGNNQLVFNVLIQQAMQLDQAGVAQASYA